MAIFDYVWPVVWLLMTYNKLFNFVISELILQTIKKDPDDEYGTVKTITNRCLIKCKLNVSSLPKYKNKTISNYSP